MRSQAKHLRRLIELFGVKTIAKEAGVTTSTVYRWKKRIPKTRQSDVKRLWDDRGNIATDIQVDAASEFSSTRYLVEKGLIPKQYLTKARKKLRQAKKALKATSRQSALERALRGKDELSTSLAQRLAEQHNLSVRQVFTFFYYL